MNPSDPGRPDLANSALEALRVNQKYEPPVVSGLSVDEAVLLVEAGYEPAGLVCGASVWRLPSLARLGVGLNENVELVDVSRAMNAARSAAIARLVNAARALGAHGVVGVHFEVGDPGGEANRKDTVHFVAMGTAITVVAKRSRRSDRSSRSEAVTVAAPFSSALTGQELVLLLRAGWRPVGLVTGTCVYHIGRQTFSTWSSSVTVNQEMTTYTNALYRARELAMGRLQEGALGLDAAGVVGVTVTERPGVWGSHVIEFSAVGTAVVPDADGHRPLQPRMVVDLG